MDVVAGVLQALFMVLGFALWVLPIAIAIWVLQRLSSMSRDLDVMRRQIGLIAEHSGAPVVPSPARPRGTRTPLWAFAAVLVVFLLVFGGLYTVGVSSSPSTIGPIEVQTAATTLPMPRPPMPAPVEDDEPPEPGD